METKFLLPNRYKSIGLIVLIMSVFLWIYVSLTGNEFSFLKTNMFAFVEGEIFSKKEYFRIVNVNLTNTLIGILFIAGSLLVAFSKEKTEDEFIMKLRLHAFQWAVLVNYLLLLIMFLFVYGIDFLTVMLYNMFTVIILFIMRFNYLLFKNRK